MSAESGQAPKLSVVIPACNEAARIAQTLTRIVAYLDSSSWRPFAVIVVDDGSSDGTRDLVLDFASGHPEVSVLSRAQNRGKGYSVKEGVSKSRGEYVLFSDADLSTPIEEVETLARWLGSGFDIAIGSRGLPESRIEVRQPWLRQKMGQTFNLLVRLLGVRGFRDTQCGFKLFTRRAAQAVFPRQTIDGFAFDVELLTIAKAQGLRVKEVAVAWRHASESKVHMARDAAKMFFDLIRIRLRALLGAYSRP
jgi:dolichyl-phosphate beta-glucosyltransferase